MISFIIPTLNEESAIEKLLSSLSKYSGPKEVIVSDGKSTDKTAEIAQKYTDKVLVYDGATRQTIGMGRNSGARAASGEYVVFMDADISIVDMNDFFTKAMKYFENNQKLVGITANIDILPENATTIDKLNFGFINGIHRFANNVLHIGMAIGEFQMVRREVFLAIGGFNESIVVGEDQEFFRRLSKSGRTLLPNELIVYHTGRRIHKVGWPNIWMKWMKDGLAVTFLKRSISKEWEVIR